MQRFHIFRSPIGSCAIAWSDEGVTRFQLPERDEVALARRMTDVALWSDALPAAVAQAVAALERYFRGEKVDFSRLPLDFRDCGSFRRAVYDAARAIPWGAAATYGEIAGKAGFPGAARAVGHALGRNPIAVIVPCHRVLAAGGKIGGFSAHGGAATKARLLEIEGVRYRKTERPNDEEAPPLFRARGNVGPCARLT